MSQRLGEIDEVPAADCKSRVLASDHAISDGDVIKARARTQQAARRMMVPRRRERTERAAQEVTSAPKRQASRRRERSGASRRARQAPATGDTGRRRGRRKAAQDGG